MRHSPSSLKLFDDCPHKFFRQRIMQDVEDPDNPAAAHGRAVHERLEHAVQALVSKPGADWPADHEQVLTWLKDTLPTYPSVATERKLALDRELQPIGFDDSECWIRGIADLLLWDPARGQMRVVDYKTGTQARAGGGPSDEVLRPGSLRAQRPKVQSVVTDVYWLKVDEHTVRTYPRSKLDDLREYITLAIARVEDGAHERRRRLQAPQGLAVPRVLPGHGLQALPTCTGAAFLQRADLQLPPIGPPTPSVHPVHL